jgi:hypothetical protein
MANMELCRKNKELHMVYILDRNQGEIVDKIHDDDGTYVHVRVVRTVRAYLYCILIKSKMPKISLVKQFERQNNNSTEYDFVNRIVKVVRMGKNRVAIYT